MSNSSGLLTAAQALDPSASWQSWTDTFGSLTVTGQSLAHLVTMCEQHGFVVRTTDRKMDTHILDLIAASAWR